MNQVFMHLWCKDLHSLWELSSESLYSLFDLSTTRLLVIVLRDIKPDFTEDMLESISVMILRISSVCSVGGELLSICHLRML